MVGGAAAHAIEARLKEKFRPLIEQQAARALAYLDMAGPDAARVDKARE